MKGPSGWGARTVGAILLAALILGAAAFTSDPPSAVAYRSPHGESECRRPDALTEFRVHVEWCNAPDDCYRSCSIEQRNRDENRRAIIRRLLERQKT